MISLDDIRAARERIRSGIARTPLERAEALEEVTGCPVWVKLENLQRTGSFKDRGALARLLELDERERAAGVLCSSAGNHGQSVAFQARRLGIRATVVMPETAPLVKISACRGYGAEVVLAGTNYDEAYARACALRDERGATLVHPFDDDAVIAGQGTVGLEILEQLPDVEAIVVPVGGGGLISGIAVAVKEQRPDVQVWGVEAEAAASMQAAIAAHERVEVPAVATLSDGIAVRRVGERTLPIVRDRVDGVVSVDDEETARAILVLMEREKTVVEGAGAVPLAALMLRRLPLDAKRVVLVLSGGNIDVSRVSRIIERGLVKDGRMVRLTVRIPDKPGALGRLARSVGEARANIVEIHHQRAFSEASLSETDVELTLETRGLDHVHELVETLEGDGHRVLRRGRVPRRPAGAP